LYETLGNLKEIKAYHASDRFQARPFNGASAQFNPK